MVALLTPSPTTPGPSTVVTVTGTGFNDAKTRIMLDGVVAAPTICSVPTGSFTQQVTVGATPGTQTISADQYVSGTWTEVETSTVTVTAPPTGGTGGFPATRASGFMATNGIAVPAMPALLTPTTYVNPFNNKITRVSNVDQRRHKYSRYSAWNRDMTKLGLFGANVAGEAVSRMLDGDDYSDIGAFSSISNSVWSNVNPNKLYGVSTNKLVTQDATTGSIVAGDGGTLYTFAAFTKIRIGGNVADTAYEGGISDDDRYMAVTAYAGGGNRLLSLDLSLLPGDPVIGNIAIPAGLDASQISRKGNYIVTVETGGTCRYTRTLTGRTVLTTAGNHGDNALDAAGNEIYVTNSDNGGVVSHKLSDASEINLFPSYGVMQYFNPGHTSGRNLDRPGWIYLSSYDYTFFGANSLLPGRDQLIAVKTDGSGQVNVFGYANVHYDADPIYYSAPHAVPSPDGKRVLFASAWGTNNAGNTYAYVAEAA